MKISIFVLMVYLTTIAINIGNAQGQLLRKKSTNLIDTISNNHYSINHPDEFLYSYEILKLDENCYRDCNYKIRYNSNIYEQTEFFFDSLNSPIAPIFCDTNKVLYIQLNNDSDLYFIVSILSPSHYTDTVLIVRNGEQSYDISKEFLGCGANWFYSYDDAVFAYISSDPVFIDAYDFEEFEYLLDNPKEMRERMGKTEHRLTPIRIQEGELHKLPVLALDSLPIMSRVISHSLDFKQVYSYIIIADSSLGKSYRLGIAVFDLTTMKPYKIISDTISYFDPHRQSISSPLYYLRESGLQASLYKYSEDNIEKLVYEPPFPWTISWFDFYRDSIVLNLELAERHFPALIPEGVEHGLKSIPIEE